MNTICRNTKQLSKAGALSAAFASAGGSEISEVLNVITLVHDTVYVGGWHGGVVIGC